MARFQIIQRNKTFFIIITSLVWAINFRAIFKNIDGHMDLGSYPTLKFEPIVILIKNILSFIVYLIIFLYSLKINSSKVTDKILVQKESGSLVSFGYKEKEERDNLLDSVSQSQNLNTYKIKILF